MRLLDIFGFARAAATGSPVRTLLMTLAMAIGVAAVVVLTALGDGARRYVVDQFSSIGTNLVIVLPGRSQTGGFSPASAVSTTPRDLTVDDARTLLRLNAVARVAPLAVGLSEVAQAGRLRETMVLGTTADYLAVRRMALGQGRFLPDDEWTRGSAVVVLGAKLATELFGAAPPLGQTVRVGGRRLRVIGVLAPAGQSLGMNSDEVALVPVALAQAMFDSNTLFRILIEARSRDAIPAAKRQVIAQLKQRHDGEEDVTVITQDAVLATFDRVLLALTAGVAGIAAISLAVAGILVMNVMLIAVTQRRKEIGLLKAIGATGAQIRAAFFTEAVMLALGGAACGLAVGQLGQFAIGRIFPDIPFTAPWWALLAAPLTAIVTSVLFTVLPARRAAMLDPVMALSKR